MNSQLNAIKAIKKMTPRKKFDIRSEIKCVVDRFKSPSDGWKLKPSRLLIARILTDLNKKRVIANGTRYEEFTWTKQEFISHMMENFEPPLREITGDLQKGWEHKVRRTLAQTPIFDVSHLDAKPNSEKVWTPKPIVQQNSLTWKLTPAEYIKRVCDVEYACKMEQNWHPNMISFNSGDKDEEMRCTYESILDDLWILMLHNSNRQAWRKLCQLLLTDKYRFTNNFYVYLSLITILVRGLPKIFIPRDVMKNPMNADQAALEIQAVCEGSYFSESTKEYFNHLVFYRSRHISWELANSRFPLGREMRLHGDEWMDDYNSHFIYWNMTWQMLSDVNRYRLINGYSPIVSNITPTGLFDGVAHSTGKAFADGAAESSKAKDFIDDAAKTTAEEIKNAGKDVAENLEEKSKSVIKDFLKQARDFTQDSAETLAKKAREVIGSIPDSFKIIGDFFGKSSEIFGTIRDTFKKVFGAVLPEDFEFTPDMIETAIEILTYWILYNHVESSVIKGAILVGICCKLKIFGHIKIWFDKILDYLNKNPEVTPTSEDGWLSFVISSPVVIGKAIAGLLASVLSGRILTEIEFGSLLKKVSNPLRDIAFIERGVGAIPKLFEHFKNFFSSISGWVMENVFGAIPEKRKVAAEIAQWLVSVEYFSTEEGRDMIRANIDAKDYAKTLYLKGITLRQLVSSTGKYKDKELHLEIGRHWRDAKAVQDFVTRLEAMSNFVPTMFHIQLVGEAGIGKSHLMKELAWTMNKEAFGPKYEKSVYSYNSDVDHFDGYAGQKTMYIDDVWRYNEPKHMSKLITLITNTPIMLPMANLEDKGTQLTSEVLITTTNLPYPVPKDIYCLEALYRRRHMLVHVTMDPQVRDPATKSFCPTLFKKFYPGENMHDYPHLNFSLLKPVPASTHEFDYEDETKESIEALKSYLHQCNLPILRPNTLKGRSTLHPDVEYLDEGELPPGVQSPCKDWHYGKFISNMVSRFRKFQENENALSLTERYQRKFDYFTRVRMMFHKEHGIAVPDEITDGYVLDMNHSGIDSTVFKIMEEFGDSTKFNEIPTPTPLEERVANGDDPIPELSEMSFEKIVKEELKPDLNFLQPDEVVKPTSLVGKGIKVELSKEINEYMKTSNHGLHKPFGIQEEDEYEDLDEMAFHRSMGFKYPEDLSPKECGEGRSSWSDKERNKFYDQRAALPEKSRWMKSETERSADRLSLSEEAQRTMRILKKKNKEALLDKANDLVSRRLTSDSNGIKLDPLFTQWGITPNLRAFADEGRFKGAQAWWETTWSPAWENSLYKVLFDDSHPAHTIPGTYEKLNGIIKAVFWESFRQVSSRTITIPKSAKEFPKELRGKDTGLSTYFLQRLHWVEDEEGNRNLYFKPDLTWEQICKQIPLEKTWTIPDKVHVIHGNKEEFDIPFDFGFIYSMNGEFVNLMLELDQYTIPQVERLIQEAKWRNSYTNFYNTTAVKDFIKGFFSRVKSVAYSYVVTPLQRFWEMLKGNKILMAIPVAIAAMGLYYLGKSFASLFYPKTEPTSKFLHRGPTSTPSRLIVKPTALEGDTNPVAQTASQLMRRNLKKITITGLKSGLDVNQQCLTSGQYVFVNKHTFFKFKDETEYMIEFKWPGTTAEYKYIINSNDIYMNDESDVAVIHARSFNMTRNIDSMLLTQQEYEDAEMNGGVTILTCEPDNYIFSQLPILRKREKVGASVKDQELFLDQTVIVQGEGIPGHSGSPVILNTPVHGSVKVLGIQAWSITGVFERSVAIQVLTQEKIAALKLAVDAQKAEIPIIRENDFEDSRVEITPCSAFSSQEENNIVTELPLEQSVGIVGKTAFRRTPIASRMDKDGYKSKRVPACLSPFDPHLHHGTEIHPLSHSIGKYFRGTIQPFDPKLLQYIEDSLVDWFSVELDKSKFQQLDIRSTITGTREDGSNPMDLRTSPGIPFVHEKRKQKGKRDYFEINEEGFVSHIDDRILAEYEVFKSKLFEGVLPLTLSYDFPKDELRPKAKAYGTDDSPPKTRSVTCMNMFYILLWRELTLDMWAAFHRRADGTFPLCPGINPDGPEWSAAFHYMNRFKNCVDFDVSNWDGFVRPELIFTVGRIISRLCGYELNSPQELAIRAILTEVMFAHIQYGTTVYQKYRGIVSGFPGTAEVNSMIHLILSLYFYMILAEPSKMNYFQAWLDNTSTMIYGDDILISISDEILEFYNGVSIMKEYESLGYPVTSASKTGEILPARPLLECTFLKSTWHPLFDGIWIRKMDLEVAYDLLYWVRAKEQPRAQFISNCTDALRIAFGHGEEAFNVFKKNLNGWLKEAQMKGIFISWSDLLEDHLSRYYDLI